MIERLKHSWRLKVLGDHLRVIHVDVVAEGEDIVKEFVFEVKGADVKLTDEEVLGDIPVALLITGDGIIDKTLSRNLGTEDKDVNDQLNEYRGSTLAHSANLEANRIHLSMLRQGTVDAIISKHLSSTNHLVHVQIGTAVLVEGLPYFQEEPSFNTGKLVFNVASGGIASVKPSSEPAGNYRTSEGELVSGDALLSFCTAISCISNWLGGFAEKGQNNAEEFYFERANKLLLIGGLAASFVVLLVNALLFLHYQDATQSLEQSLSEHHVKMNRLNNLQKDIEYRQGLLELTGGGLDGEFAFMVDHIGKTVPEKVQLSQLSVYPIKPRKRDSDPIAVLSNTLKISGTCQESGDLDQWINRLLEINSIDKVAVQSFEMLDGKSLNRFVLNVVLR